MIRTRLTLPTYINVTVDKRSYGLFTIHIIDGVLCKYSLSSGYFASHLSLAVIGTQMQTNGKS